MLSVAGSKFDHFQTCAHNTQHVATERPNAPNNVAPNNVYNMFCSNVAMVLPGQYYDMILYYCETAHIKKNDSMKHAAFSVLI